jgi:hypothetical protein
MNGAIVTNQIDAPDIRAPAPQLIWVFDRHPAVQQVLNLLQRRWSGAWLVVGLVLAVVGCTHFSPRDYVFGAEGLVTDSAGVPLEGVRVLLSVGGNEPAYSAIEPVRERTFLTDARGRFQFVYITHHLDTPYVLRFEKGGYQSQKVESASPPVQKHAITLATESSPAR